MEVISAGNANGVLDSLRPGIGFVFFIFIALLIIGKLIRSVSDYKRRICSRFVKASAFLSVVLDLYQTSTIGYNTLGGLNLYISGLLVLGMMFLFFIIGYWYTSTSKRISPEPIKEKLISWPNALVCLALIGVSYRIHDYYIGYESAFSTDVIVTNIEPQ